jgi:ATP-dependent protease ClpP protease subunit
MEFKYIKNISDTQDEATLLLYDVIGRNIDEDGNTSGIDGQIFAKEIQYLQNTVKQINVRINSAGGNVLDGYSIVSAIVNSKVPVCTYVDGLAASIAGVIALTGYKKCMMDYGTLMLHNPFSENGQADQKVLDLVKDTLVTILKNNTPLDEKQISDVMDAETYYSSEQALQLGLVDEVIASGQKVKVDVSDLAEMQTIYNQLIKPKEMEKENQNTPVVKVENEAATAPIEQPKINNEMKNKLGLAETANEDEVNSALEALLNERKALKDALDAVEKEKETAHKAKVEEMVNSYYQEGKVADEEREAITKLALTDFDAVKNMLDKIGTTKSVKIYNQEQIATPQNDRANWTIRDWEKKDPKGLLKLKNETPSIYQSMYEQFYMNKKK